MNIIFYFIEVFLKAIFLLFYKHLDMSTSRNCFFPEATTYPDFFNHNLTDDNRVLKVVSGGYCWARAFYYQRSEERRVGKECRL